ncbi:hypothetical protein BGX26_006088 [Mortierella sp. AD094]|nr:hypothetical protein BGX26_006088 [Mortierella sp. AD094]
MDATITVQPPAITPAPSPTGSEIDIALATTTRNNTLTSPSNDPIVTPPRDGGARAWLVVLGSFLIQSFAFAPTEYIFGVFELHYRTIYHDAAHSSIAFIGTTGSAVTYLAGFLAGIIADRFGFKATAFTGTVVMALSLILASFAKQVSFQLEARLIPGGPKKVEGKDHVDIAQLQSEKSVEDGKYEEHKLDEKVPEDKPSFFAALKVFKDPRFLFLSLAEFIVDLAFLVPLYYMQTYAVFIGLSAESGALILGLSNGASFAGRVILGLVSDYFSNAKVLLVCAWCTAFAVLVLWTISHSFGLLLLMGLMYGFFVGGYISLVPVAVAQSFGAKQMASTMGLMFTAAGLAMFGGAPLAGFLLDVTQPNTSYLPVILASGLAITLGALCVSIWAYLDWKVKRAQLVKNK